nr:MAG TPA: hypothetical protein [Caudoviricetes sp.]
MFVPRFDACHYTLDALEYNNRSSDRQTVGEIQECEQRCLTIVYVMPA